MWIVICYVIVLSFCLTECLEFAKEKYPNGKFSFCGKSIGTQAFCLLPDIANKINFDLSSSRFAWLTPVWKREDCLQSMIDFKYRSQYIIGDNDSHYSVASHERVKNNSLASVIVIKNADHSMDNDLSVEEKFKIHREVFDNLFKFLL